MLAAQEAGATPLPLILAGRSTLGAPQPHQDPLQLFAFPATGDSTIAELPGGNSNLDFGIEINIQRGICFPAVPWGVRFLLFFSPVGTGFAGEALFLGSFVLISRIQSPWGDPAMRGVCLLKDLQWSLWQRGYFPLKPSPRNIVLILLTTQRSRGGRQEWELAQLGKVQAVSLRPDST